MIEFDKIKTLLELAIEEDTGENLFDATSDSLFEGEKIEAILFNKEPIVLCGIDMVDYVFKKFDENTKITRIKEDGDFLENNTVFAKIEGDAAALLKAERTALNFLQRLSGVATMTRRYKEALNNDKIALLDTRKTLPGYRYLDKYAVKIGGGKNHRMGLYDMVMIKDNHKNIVGGVDKAFEKIKGKVKNLKIEVEVENLAEVEKIASFKPDVIMLDNMSNEEIKEASAIIRKISPATKIEVSGGIVLERLPSLGKLDIDYISTGALTHSAKAVDISMEIIL